MPLLSDLVKRGPLADRPAFGAAGRIFIASDTAQQFYDTGSAWEEFAIAGGGAEAGTEVREVLAESVLGSDGATVDWTVLEPGYDRYEIFLLIRGTQAASEQAYNMTFNGDTDNSRYRVVYRLFDGSTTYQAASNMRGPSVLAAASRGAGEWTQVRMVIERPHNSFAYKTAEVVASMNNFSDLRAFCWQMTTPINRITFEAVSGNFKAGSVFRLVGVRSA